MRERRKKAGGHAASGLPPLSAEGAAALQDQLARVAAALASDQDLQAILDLVTTQPQDLLWDLHLMAALGTLPHPVIPALLAALFGSSRDKGRRKALKRALHLLKTRGVPVPPELLPREEVSLVRPQGGAAPVAYVSPIFGRGERYVILEGPKEALAGNFLVARISDREGFRECHLLSLKSRQRQEFWDHFRQQGLGEWATVPPAYGVRLLAEAYEHNPQAESGSSRYVSLKERIYLHWGRPEEGPDLDILLPDLNPGDRSRFLEQSRRLMLDPLFQSWLPEMQELTIWLNKLQEVQDSPLVLTEPQRQLRVEGVVDEAVAALYPPETRQYWSKRLLAMAYYLDLKGRGDEARAAQAAGEDLTAAERGPLSGENPFLHSLVWHALKLAWELGKKGQDAAASPGLVTPAPESLLIRR
jgi:hypothetical protein